MVEELKNLRLAIKVHNLFKDYRFILRFIIGNQIIILPNSIISHDNIIGDFTSIAGVVCISGSVTVGESCYLGTNCSIIQNVSIGRNSLIGMGSTVLHNIENNSVYIGNQRNFYANCTGLITSIYSTTSGTSITTIFG